MELCKTIKAKIPEPEPIVGTWRTRTNFRYYDYNMFVGYVYFVWNNDSTRITARTNGECFITFKNDGTLQISKLTYPVVEITCPKIRDWQQKESLKEVSGSGFWQLNDIKDGVRNYLLQIDIDGSTYSMWVYASKNSAGVYNFYTSRGYGLEMKEGVLFAPVMTKTNIGTYKHPEWKYSITDKIEDKTNTCLELINWIKTNEYKEEEKSK